MKTRSSWLDFLPQSIIGAEDDENGQGAQGGDEGNDSGEQNGSPQGGAEGSQGKGKDEDDDPHAGLKTALAQERAERRKAEKALEKINKDKEAKELAEKGELEQATTKLQRAEERATKLASGFLRSNLDAAIRSAAAEFVDPTDAIDGVDRSALSYEQDEDDPSNVTIDQKSVEAAVKKLATKKPHFLKSTTDDGDATGSSFGGGKGRKGDSKQVYAERYPSL